MFLHLRFATLGCAAFVSAAAAQTPPVKPVVQTQANVEPQSTMAAFGDWVLRCQRRAEGAIAVKICEVNHTIQNAQQQAPVAQIALGRVIKSEPMHLTAQLPTNVTFPSIVKLLADDKDTHPLELAWRRCIQNGCFADAPLSDEQTRQLHNRTGSGIVEFVEGAGRTVRLPLSFDGLAPALDALLRE